MSRSIRLVVSFDPGVSNFGVAGLSISDERTYLEFQKTFDIRGQVRDLDPEKLHEVLDEVDQLVGVMEHKYKMENETLWVLEYQPPLATRQNPGLVRNNTFIEAFVQCWIMEQGFPFKKVAPASVKRHFNFPKAQYGGQYHSNKRYSISQARLILGGVWVNDHIADCVLNGVYGASSSL